MTFQTRASVIVQHTVIEDSAVGIYGLVAGPDASFHMAQDKFVTIKNSVISGRFIIKNSFEKQFITEVNSIKFKIMIGHPESEEVILESMIIDLIQINKTKKEKRKITIVHVINPFNMKIMLPDIFKNN